MEFVFSFAAIKRLVYLLLVAVIALTAQHSMVSIQHSDWLIWAALGLAALVTSGHSFLRRITVLLLTGLAMAVSVLLSGIVAGSPLWLGVYLFILTSGFTYLGARYPDYYFSFFIICVFAIATTTPGLSLLESSSRSGFVLLGAVTATLLQLFFILQLRKNTFRRFTRLFLRHFLLLMREIINCLLHTEYAENVYLFERRLHIQKNKCLRLLAKLSDVAMQAPASSRDAELAVIAAGSRLYALAMDCAVIRRRIQDHATFTVCAAELQSVMQSLQAFGAQLPVKLTQQKQTLLNAIESLEANYQRVLHVSVQDPLAFLLFMASLKALAEEMVVFYEAASGIV